MRRIQTLCSGLVSLCLLLLMGVAGCGPTATVAEGPGAVAALADLPAGLMPLLPGLTWEDLHQPARAVLARDAADSDVEASLEVGDDCENDVDMDGEEEVKLGTEMQPEPTHLPRPEAPRVDDDCETLRKQLRADMEAMHSTDEWTEMQATDEFKAMVKTLRKMQRKHCPLHNTAVPLKLCKKLKALAFKQQMALLRTPQFRALATTDAFKTFIGHARDAMRRGCLKDMKLGLQMLARSASDDDEG